MHSEEVRLECVKVFMHLYENIQHNKSCTQHLCSLRLRPIIAQNISSLLDFSRNEKLRMLQIESCKALDGVSLFNIFLNGF